MADSIAEALSLKVIEYMVADSRFDDITAFFVGSPMRVMSELIPNCEIAIITSDTIEVVLGGRQKHNYFGQCRFYDNFQDLITVTDRVGIVPSYQSIYKFCNHFKSLFMERANRTLGGYAGTIDSIAFTVVEIAMGELAYGINPDDERLENWSNFGKVEFRISTYEQSV